MTRRRPALPDPGTSERIAQRPPGPRDRFGLAALLGLWIALCTAFALLCYARWGLLDIAPEAAAAVAAGLGLCAALGWVVRCPTSALPVVLGPDEMALPRLPFSRRPLRVGYADVYFLRRERSAGGERLTIGLRRRLPVIHRASQFARPESIGRLERALRARIASLPDGAARLDGMARRCRVASARAGIPWITLTALVAMLVAFGIECRAGALGRAEDLIRLGANAGWLVERGEWWRLATGSLLHRSAAHLAGNGVLLLILASRLERLYGGARYTAVLLASALGGAVASAWLPPPLASVGASAGAYGLVGSWFVLNLRFLEDLPPGLRLGPWYLPATLAAGTALDSALPGMDGAAHLGGLLSGAAVTALVTAGGELGRLRRRAHPAIRGAAGAFTLFFAAAIAAAALNAR